MAGYSGTPLPRKLGIRSAARLFFARPPDNWSTVLGTLPDDAEVVDSTRPFDLAVIFSLQRAEIEPTFSEAIGRMADGGMIWLAWPKKASGFATDLTGDVIRGAGLDAGLVDVKVCAIDEFWSGLKFVRRRGEKR